MPRISCSFSSKIEDSQLCGHVGQMGGMQLRFLVLSCCEAFDTLNNLTLNF